MTVHGTVGWVDAWLLLIATSPAGGSVSASVAQGRSRRPWNVRHDRDRRDAREHQAGPFEVGVDQVELVRPVEHAAHRREHVRQRIAAVPDRSQRLGNGHDVAAGDLGVAAGERRDVVAATIQLHDQLVDDPLGAAVARAAGPARRAGRRGRCEADGSCSGYLDG